MPQKQQTITVGRDPKNSVVLDESNVSSFHARLICTADKIVLEDLGSTNGTSVGRVENKIQRSDVKLDDTIFFGSTPYVVSDLMSDSTSKVAKPQLATDIEPARRESNKTSRGLPPVAWVCLGALVVAVGLGLFAWNAREGDSKLVNRSTASKEDAQSGRKASSRDGAASKVDPDVAVTADRGEPKDNPLPSGVANVSLSAKEQLARAVFVVVCSNKKLNTSYRIGTAFAIDARHVATSASVIQAMQTLQADGYSSVTLRSPAAEKTYSVTSIHGHPQYEKMSAQVTAAQREHDAIQDELRSQPPTREAYELVKASLLATRLKAVQAMESKTSCDVAVIELQQSLKHWLTGASSESSLRPNLKLEVSGYGVDESDPYFDESERAELLTMSSRVRQIFRPSPEAAMRLMAGGSEQQQEYSFSGSPILNAQGQVVAIYSRPTPATRGADNAEPTDTFDAPLFARVRECLAD